MDFIFSQSVGQPSSTIFTYFPIIFIGLIIYFLILRPQSKQRKQHETALSELKKGDKIITRGGLYGKIVNFQGKNDNKATIDVGSGVKLNVARSYIVGLSNNTENETPDKAN